MINTNEQTEKEDIKNAIKEINFLIQVMKDTPVSNSITRDLKDRFIGSMIKEEQDYSEYFDSIFYSEEEQKKIDNLIDCQIEDMKIRRDEEHDLLQIKNK